MPALPGMVCSFSLRPFSLPAAAFERYLRQDSPTEAVRVSSLVPTSSSSSSSSSLSADKPAPPGDWSFSSTQIVLWAWSTPSTMNSVPIAAATPDQRARAPYGSAQTVESTIYSVDARPSAVGATCMPTAASRAAADDVDYRRRDLADPAALGLAGFAATTFVLRYAAQPRSPLGHRMQTGYLCSLLGMVLQGRCCCLPSP